MMNVLYDKRTCACGLSLVELLIAIGIMGVTMTLIGAAFPAGVMMSIAVSDETTSQAVFQEALSVIGDNYSVSEVGPLASNYAVIRDEYLGSDAADGLDNRKYGGGLFSWSALVRPVGAAGPMGNLCQVLVVVSRRPSGSSGSMPTLVRVNCTGSDATAWTLTIHPDDFAQVPSAGYIIDSTTGIAYLIISRDEGGPSGTKVTLLSEPPSNADIGGDRDFWVVSEPGSDSRSPAVRVFQAMRYLP